MVVDRIDTWLANGSPAHAIARGIASTLAARFPGQYILSAQAKRSGHIFLDYLRNGRGTTAIGTYSPRARDGFRIAAPVTWARVEAGIRPDAFAMAHPLLTDRGGTRTTMRKQRAGA
jgi:bifunctional non-homologous end joining protein LigD